MECLTSISIQYMHFQPQPPTPRTLKAIPPDPILNMHDHIAYPLEQKQDPPFPLARLANCFAPVSNQRAIPSYTLCSTCHSQPARKGVRLSHPVAALLSYCLFGAINSMSPIESKLGNALTHCLSSVCYLRFSNLHETKI